MAATLKTKQCSWAKCFRVIVAQAEKDPVLKRVLGPRLRSWKGDDSDKGPLTATADGPVMRLTPQPKQVQYYSPDSQAGKLFVLVEFSVQSLCVDDVLNLWETLVDALSPADADFTRRLVDADAETGDIVFSDPAYDPKPEADPSGVFNAAGVFYLDVVRRMY